VADGFAVEAPCLAASRCRPLKEILASSPGLSARLCRECLRCLRAWRLDLVIAGGTIRFGNRDTVGEGVFRGGIRYGRSMKATHPAGSVRAELILSAVLALIVAGFSALLVLI